MSAKVIALVTGGREFLDSAYVVSSLSRLHLEVGPFALLIHGAARGVDTLADMWAAHNGVQPAACRALWDFYRSLGRMNFAGHARNSAMLLLRPHVVIAFPGGRGTANMVVQTSVKIADGLPIRLIDLADDYRTVRLQTELAQEREP